MRKFFYFGKKRVTVMGQVINVDNGGFSSHTQTKTYEDYGLTKEKAITRFILEADGMCMRDSVVILP